MKTQLTITLVLSTLLALSGCTTSPEPSAEMKKITNQQSEIEQLKAQQLELQDQLATWQAVRPEVENIVSLETEIEQLIQQADDLRIENEMKAEQEKRRLYEARPYFMLQLAALESVDAVKKEWLSLQAIHPDALNSLAARSQKVKVNGKTYFRLKVGEFDYKEDAMKMCEQFIAQQVDCLVVTNEGTKLPL